MIKRGQSRVGHTQPRSPPPSALSDKSFLFFISKFISFIEQNIFLIRTLFFFLFLQLPTHAGIKLCLPGSEQGCGMHLFSALRPSWCVRCCVFMLRGLTELVALDTNSPLPLFNSLTHLTYLTSTSPRIREIMVMDGGLERLVRMLHDFCLSPPPPENPALLYGLLPPNYHPPKPVPTLIPKSFDKHAAYRFSLAFQCIVNIGVRGSELIRSRVVQAGTLDVVGCILESWLASKGFAVGPSSSATGMPRETREQRAARKQVQAELRARQQAAELARALERRQDISHDISIQTIRGRSRPTDLANRTIVPAAVEVRPCSDSVPFLKIFICNY